jgi:glutathione peroxidase
MNRRSFLAGTAALAGAARLTAASAWAQGADVSARTGYGFAFAGLDGGQISLGEFAGRPIMVVNTASLCGFTPQYKGLQALWQRFSPRGLMLIGVPSNDFGGQEPGGAEDIHQTAETYGVGFPIAAKVKVLGPEAHPFYRWAALERPHDLPKWNFHKYLIGRNGHITAVFASGVEPGEPRVATAIEAEFSSSAG